MNIQLTPAIRMPVVGFGTYLIKDEDARASVHYAIRSGYRHVNTAEIYRNEKGVGLGIKAIR